MRVYKFIENSNTYSVPFDWDDDDQNSDYIDEIIRDYFDAKRRVGAAWQPSFFGVVNPKQKLGDLGSLVGNDAIVMSQKAVDALRPLIEHSVELLPYDTEVGPYYLVNVLDEGQYLDRDKTDCDRRLPNGLCAGINRFVFDASKLQGKHIFRIPDSPVFRYVSDAFIDACQTHGLQGIYLTDKAEVWDSNAL
jgi:hypothetical protein